MSEQKTEKKRRFLGWYFDTPLVWRVLIALILGAIIGLIVGPDIVAIEPLGALMLRALQMVVLPLIFFAIVVGVGGTPASKMGRIAGKILLYYIITTVFAASFGIALAHIIKPGMGATLAGATAGAEAVEVQSVPISEMFLNLIPNNVVGAFVEGSYLQILFFALFVGLAISFLRDSKDERIYNAVMSVYNVCEGASEIMFTITQAVLEYTPVGVFALIAVVFAQEGIGVIGSLGKLILACYIGYAFQVFIVYSGLLKGAKLSPKNFFSHAKDVMLMAFATRSSNSVLPLSMTTAEEELGVSRTVSGFTLPLGAQVNMDGEAYYQILSVFFIANAIGLNLSPGQQFLMVLVVTLGSIGTAGVAGAGPVVLLAVMEMVGIPVAQSGTPAAAAFALILGIDVILDMGRTMANVTGDMVGTCIVAKSEGLLDEDKWK